MAYRQRDPRIYGFVSTSDIDPDSDPSDPVDPTSISFDAAVAVADPDQSGDSIPTAIALTRNVAHGSLAPHVPPADISRGVSDRDDDRDGDRDDDSDGDRDDDSDSESEEDDDTPLHRMLKKAETDLVEELTNSTPENQEKIKSLTRLVINLDEQIKNLKSRGKGGGVSGDGGDSTGGGDSGGRGDGKSGDDGDGKSDGKSDEQEESKKEQFNLMDDPSKLAKVRWAFNKGDKTAKGCVQLNPKSIQQPCKDTIHVTFVYDVSYSMNDGPLEDLGIETQNILRDLAVCGVKIRITCIRYGFESDTFIYNRILTRDTIRDVCDEIRIKIGTPVVKTGPEKGKCLMGKIRTDTRFEKPLKDMFESLEMCTVGSDDVGIGIWFSDGLERSSDTDVVALAKKAFSDEIDGGYGFGKGCGVEKMNIDIYSCAYGMGCGTETTKMQKLVNWWGENCPEGSGLFCSANTISGLAKFAKESADERLFSPIATQIVVTLPNGETRSFDKILGNPIDIPFEAHVAMPLRLGIDSKFALENIASTINIKFCQPGFVALPSGYGSDAGADAGAVCSPVVPEVFSVDFPTIDKCQIKPNGELASSAQTLIAHIHNDINKLQKNVTGLKENADEDKKIHKKSLRLLKQIGVWRNGLWKPEKFNVGSNNKTAAVHQIPLPDRYTELEVLITLADKMLTQSVTKSDSYSVDCALRSFGTALTRGTTGQTQRSGYCAYGAAVIDDGYDDDDSD